VHSPTLQWVTVESDATSGGAVCGAQGALLVLENSTSQGRDVQWLRVETKNEARGQMAAEPVRIETRHEIAADLGVRERNVLKEGHSVRRLDAVIREDRVERMRG